MSGWFTDSGWNAPCDPGGQGRSSAGSRVSGLLVAISTCVHVHSLLSGAAVVVVLHVPQATLRRRFVCFDTRKTRNSCSFGPTARLESLSPKGSAAVTDAEFEVSLSLAP